MNPLFFFQGLIIGFCVAAPVGPIGILCIRRTLRFGRLSGIMSGLGAATADTFYGAIAAFGLTFVSDAVEGNSFWLQLIGGVVLLILGSRIVFAKPDAEITVSHKTLVRDFISTFFLTLSNPLTAFAFLAIFAGIGLDPDTGDAALMVPGVFVGAASWWLLLSEGVTLFRQRISQEIMAWINKVAGVLIFALGVLALVYL